MAASVIVGPPSGAAIVLVFIGGKMLVMPWFHMPVQWSLAIVGTIIAMSVFLSLKFSTPKPVVVGATDGRT